MTTQQAPVDIFHSRLARDIYASRAAKIAQRLVMLYIRGQVSFAEFERTLKLARKAYESANPNAE